jgi:hypothetical protein
MKNKFLKILIIIFSSILLGECKIEGDVEPMTSVKEIRKKQKEKKTYPVGEEFIFDNFAYKFSAVRAVKQLGGSLNNEKTNSEAVFYLIDFEIKNLKKQTITFLNSDFKIKDKKEREYEISNRGISALTMAGKQDLMLFQLQPGIKKRSTLVFELPIDSANQSLWLIVPKKGFFDTEKVLVELPIIKKRRKF